MDRLEAMSIVLAVAEAGSLSAAARRLNTPVATASRKITAIGAAPRECRQATENLLVGSARSPESQ